VLIFFRSRFHADLIIDLLCQNSASASGMADVAFLFGYRLALRLRHRLATGADVDCNAAPTFA
jgi:hypothetical protein